MMSNQIESVYRYDKLEYFLDILKAGNFRMYNALNQYDEDELYFSGKTIQEILRNIIDNYKIGDKNILDGYKFLWSAIEKVTNRKFDKKLLALELTGVLSAQKLISFILDYNPKSYIFCTSADLYSKRMWTKYADYNCGIVIELSPVDVENNQVENKFELDSEVIKYPFSFQIENAINIIIKEYLEGNEQLEEEEQIKKFIKSYHDFLILCISVKKQKFDFEKEIRFSYFDSSSSMEAIQDGDREYIPLPITNENLIKSIKSIYVIKNYYNKPKMKEIRDIIKENYKHIKIKELKLNDLK